MSTPTAFKKRYIPKVGDKVRVPWWMAISRHFNRGVITYVNGGNVLVRLNFRGIECHLLITEVIKGWR